MGLEEVPTPPDLFIEPGIFDGNGRLGGEEGEEVAVLRRKALLRALVAHGNHTHKPLPVQQGLGQDRRGAKALHEERVHVR